MARMHFPARRRAGEVDAEWARIYRPRRDVEEGNELLRENIRGELIPQI